MATPSTPPANRFIPARTRGTYRPGWCVTDRRTGMSYGEAFTGPSGYRDCLALCTALNAHPDCERAE